MNENNNNEMNLNTDRILTLPDKKTIHGANLCQEFIGFKGDKGDENPGVLKFEM